MRKMDEIMDALRAGFEEMVEELKESAREDSVEVVVKLEVPGSDRRRAFVGGRRVRFDNGTGRISVAPGTYRLIWDVQGMPGTEYKVGITAPPPAAFERTLTIGDGGDDGGTHKFQAS
ncbi:MAG TPA: hypothetical protein VF746_25960 [Longimicrobium sp.]